MLIVRLIFIGVALLIVGSAWLLSARMKHGRHLAKRRQSRTTNSPLSELLSMEASLSSTGEPHVVLKAKQPYLLLSRKQVRDFYQMIHQMEAALAQLPQTSSSAQPEEGLETYDQAEIQLHSKLRFISRPAHLNFPALLRLETPTCQLSEDELMVLEIEVMMANAIVKAEAFWWYAQPPSLQGIHHLVRADAAQCHGPALCGQLPPQGQGALFKGWFLVPVEGCLTQKRSAQRAVRFGNRGRRANQSKERVSHLA
jgi:hypothetical protein